MPIRIKDIHAAAPFVFGSIATTLADNTSSMTGTFAQAATRTGSIDASLGVSAANFDGVFTATPERTGTIGVTLEDHQGSFSDPRWNAIPATLPAGTEHEMLQYLSDTNNDYPTRRAMKGGQVVEATTDLIYTAATGILSYGAASEADVYMEAETAGVLSTAAAIDAAISALTGGETLLIADGTYTFTSAVRIINVDNVTIRSDSGNRSACILEGDEMSDTASILQIFQVNGDNCTIQDLTMRKVGQHIIQCRGENNASGLTVRNCVLQDSYQQILKVSSDNEGASPVTVSSDGLVEDNLFELTVPALNYYNGGIDAQECVDWTVRRNTFRNFQAPAVGVDPTQSAMEHAIHFWRYSQNTTAERNLIIDCDRGIGYWNTLDPAGVIKSNHVVRTTAENFPDVGIEVWDSQNAQIYNNTVYLADVPFAGIDYRFATTTGLEITNNLTNSVIAPRDGATGTETTNNESAALAWFLDVLAGPDIDPNFSSATDAVRDQGTVVLEVIEDFYGTGIPSEPVGAYDIGAFEMSGSGAAFNPTQVAGIWSWVHVRDDDTNFFVVDTGNFGALVIDSAVNRADPGVNDFETNAVGDASSWRPGYNGAANGISIPGYTSPFTPLMLDSYQPVQGLGGPFGQFMEQPGNLAAAGEFYLVAAHTNSRTAGIRWMWGSDNSNYVKFETQGSGADGFQLRIASGTEVKIVPDGVVSNPGAYISEIWRDSSNQIFCRVNGGTAHQLVTVSGTFAMSGFGGFEGASDSGWDEYMFEMIAYQSLPSAAERDQIVLYLNGIWNIY